MLRLIALIPKLELEVQTLKHLLPHTIACVNQAIENLQSVIKFPGAPSSLWVEMAMLERTRDSLHQEWSRLQDEGVELADIPLGVNVVISESNFTM